MTKLWLIEGEGGGRFDCHGKCWPEASNLARHSGHEITVRYLGPKRPGNRDVRCSDFLALPDGSFDYAIDPTWWERQRHG